MTETSDRLLVTDIHLVKQRCSSVTVAFEDESVADYFDEQIDQGFRPDQFARVWVHTHPGNSPHPSGTDEETFCRVFGNCDWALMFVLARGGATYARLRFNVGPCGETCLPVDVDYSQPFPATDQAAWQTEYENRVQVENGRGFWPYDERDSPNRRVLPTADEFGEHQLFEDLFLEGQYDFG